jgi:sulfur carrier protein
MRITVNGTPREVGPDLTVAQLVASSTRPHPATHAAVARNGEVVPRSAWPTTPLADGDRIELLGAAQGG